MQCMKFQSFLSKYKNLATSLVNSMILCMLLSFKAVPNNITSSSFNNK